MVQAVLCSVGQTKRTSGVLENNRKNGWEMKKLTIGLKNIIKYKHWTWAYPRATYSHCLESTETLKPQGSLAPQGFWHRHVHPGGNGHSSESPAAGKLIINLNDV